MTPNTPYTPPYRPCYGRYSVLLRYEKDRIGGVAIFLRYSKRSGLVRLANVTCEQSFSRSNRANGQHEMLAVFAGLNATLYNLVPLSCCNLNKQEVQGPRALAICMIFCRMNRHSFMDNSKYNRVPYTFKIWHIARKVIACISLITCFL